MISWRLEDWADELNYLKERNHFGVCLPDDCRKCRADRIYRDLLELKALCEKHEKKEIK